MKKIPLEEIVIHYDDGSTVPLAKLIDPRLFLDEDGEVYEVSFAEFATVTGVED